ncbi:quinol:electron acceptor oxidoreductase subunit ActD [Leptothrix ochracea]|uniref:quinol:electron acceptor oxidoreductase subunit ActD n=1 Tax=Leptothrix ochracea TaxID=735331 RepID=UPI0034E206CB
MAKAHTLGLFDNFDEAAQVIETLKSSSIDGFSIDDVVLKSPIEHQELAESLGPRPVYVQLYTLIGAVLGAALGFLFIASSQASFLLQYRGGKPVIPLPPNFVLTYEFFILCGVLMTVVGCFIAWKLPGNRSPLYNASVSEDKIGILVKAEPAAIQEVNAIFHRFHAAEVIGEQAA